MVSITQVNIINFLKKLIDIYIIIKRALALSKKESENKDNFENKNDEMQAIIEEKVILLRIPIIKYFFFPLDRKCREKIITTANSITKSKKRTIKI